MCTAEWPMMNDEFEVTGRSALSRNAPERIAGFLFAVNARRGIRGTSDYSRIPSDCVPT